jgi:DNA (cytosine-5)-methyltransferase 1
VSRHPRFSVVSLFSGCGGFDLAAEMTGVARVVWANDSFPAAAATYRRNFRSPIVCADIRRIDPPDIPCDLVIGGPPCQDYSVLWLHEGARTARGALYMEYVRFLAEMRPKAFIFENVKGLLSANHGEAWALLRAALKAPSRAMGDEAPHVYYDLSVQVVNFADLGAPQLRERLIVIGTRSDLRIPAVKPPTPYAGCHRTVADALDDPRNPLPALGTNNHVLHTDAPDVIARLKLIPPGGNYTDIPEGHPLRVKGLISHVYRRLHPDAPAYTIVAGGGGGSMGYHHREPRSLTNRERARLQTFPDDFAFEGSIREIRTQVGNAVPPQAMSTVIETVLAALRAYGVAPGDVVPSRRLEARPLQAA